MNNMLTRGILRLSKRGSKSGSVSDTQSIRSSVSEVTEPLDSNGAVGNDEWTKYDERLIDCINKSDISKLKETLKKKGVSPVKVSRVGKTAIHIAVKKRCMEAVDLMLLEHPDLSCIDMQGRTVYHTSALNGDIIMLKKLLDYSKWNLDIKDIKGMTALHYAVQSGETQCVKLLLENDSPVEIKDGESRTPLLQAVAEDREKIATLLIEHGVNVNEQDKQGRSAIVIACSLGMTQIVSLLLAKGADRSVMNRKSINLDRIASEAGHSDIVEILNKGIQNSPTENGNGHHFDAVIDSNGTFNGDISVNGHNGHSELDGKTIDISINSSLIIENGHDKIESDKISITMENGQRKNSTPVPSIHILQPGGSQRRSVYNNDDSLTSAIIESLMGFDAKSDTISETSVTEDQLHLYEKADQERKDLKAVVAKKDLRIEELQAEIDSLKNKVSMEMELRYSAEKEVQQLKLDLETRSQRSECEAEQESLAQHDLLGERLSDAINSSEYIDKMCEEHNGSCEDIVDDDDEDNDTVNNDDVENHDTDEVDEIEEDEDEYNEKNAQVESDIVYMDNTTDDNIENECDADIYSSHDSDDFLENGHDGHIPDSDTDDSVSVVTGYRKKSLGTAKQHINMLEERILSLEDELSFKGEEITRLQLECNSAKELVDLNNNTTIPLEIHNELKSDCKRERNAFKEQIASLEDKVKQLEQNVGDANWEKKEMQTQLDSSNDLENKLNCEIESNKKLQKQIKDLHNQINILKTQIEASEMKNGDSGMHMVKPDIQLDLTEEIMVDDHMTKLHCDINGHADLEVQVISLKEKADKLQEQLSNYDKTLEETLLCYRNTLISLYQNNLDSRLEEILASIVKLRAS